MEAAASTEPLQIRKYSNRRLYDSTRSRHITGLTMLKQAGLDNFEVTACCDVVDDNVQAVAAHARTSRSPNGSISAAASVVGASRRQAATRSGVSRSISRWSRALSVCIGGQTRESLRCFDAAAL